MCLSCTRKHHAHLTTPLVLYISLQLQERRHDIRAPDLDDERDRTLQNDYELGSGEWR